MARVSGTIGILISLGLAALGAAPSTAFRSPTAHQVTARQAPRLACDLARSIAASVPGVTIESSAGLFRDEAFPRPVRGCRLAIMGSFADAPSGADAANRLRAGFQARGWREMRGYAADGKDGTAFAFRRAGVACLFRGAWNGGVDGEPPVPREETYRVSVLCTRAVPRE